MTDDPLRGLIVEEQDLARETLADALRPFVRFTQKGELLLEPAFQDVSTLRRVCCVLLAARALAVLGLRETATVQNRDVVGLTGMPPGTVGPKLAELRDLRLAEKEGSGWVLTTHGLRRAVDLLRGEANGR